MAGVSAFDGDRKVKINDADWAGDEKERDEKERKLPADDGEVVKEPEVGPVVKTLGGDEIRPVGQDDSLAGPSGYPPEPPPEFSHYQAEKQEDDDGNIFSHDHHLNTDGEALYRFLLHEGAKPPRVTAVFHGSHTETRTRQVTRRDSNGHSYTTTETYTVTIEDFAFTIDITQHLLAEPRGPPIWIVGERDPAHRGNRKRQVDNTPYMVGDETSTTDLEAGAKAVSAKSSWRRKATDVEKGSANGRRDRRWAWGLPSWVLLPGETRGTEANIEDPIARDVFQGSYGGGDWDVAGSSFALTKWVHLTDSRPGQTAEEYQTEYDANHPNLVAEPRKLLLKQTPRGVSQLIGLREGEWFAQWKDTVGALIRQRHISYGAPLRMPMNIRGEGLGYGLDGFK
ncbi:hypothetical protein FS837_008980 [Tulasnella sp. UAMH 9824]|nr:hypothetical protein FS837_008980 [Tulasnella sp. UAMH 9824]